MLARKIIESLNVSPIYFIVAFNLSQNLSLIAGICIYDCKPIQLDVIRWCESKDFTFPKELEELVIKYNKSKDVEIYVQDSVLNKENIPKESYKGQKTGGKNNLLNEKMFFIEKIKEELNEKIPDYEKKLISNILTKYQKSELKALSVDNAKKTLREWTKKYFNNKTLFDRSEE